MKPIPSIVLLSLTLAVLAGAAQTPGATRRVAPNQRAEAAQEGSTTQPSDQRGSAASPLVVTLQPPSGTREQEELERLRLNEAAADRKKQALLSQVLAFIGLCTALVVGWQALETRRAAQAAKVTADVSERAFLLLNQPNLTSAGWAAAYAAPIAMGDDARISVVFRIVNDSPVPAVLKTLTQLTVFGEEDWQRLSRRIELDEQGTRNNPLPFSQDFTFAAALKEETLFYSETGLDVSVVGRVTYTDVFCKEGEIRTANFGRVLRLRHPDRDFSYEVSLLPAGQLEVLLKELTESNGT